MNRFQHCSPNYFKYGQEIFDSGCRLTGQKCAPNMVFSSVENVDTDCTQRCICAEGYDYSEDDEQCIKEVKTFLRLIVMIFVPPFFLL